MHVGETHVSLFDVSKRRLPFYLVVVEAAVLWGLAISLKVFIGYDGTELLRNLLFQFIDNMYQYMNTYVSGTILACGALEGFIVGLAELRRRRSNQRSKEEGRQEAIEDAIKALEKAGQEDGANLLRERNRASARSGTIEKQT